MRSSVRFHSSVVRGRAFAAAVAFSSALAFGLSGCGGGDGDGAGASSDPAGTPAVPTAPGADPAPPTAPTPPPTPTAPTTPGTPSAAGVPIDHAAFGGAMSDVDLEAATGRVTAFVAAWKATRADRDLLSAQDYAAALVAALATQADARYVNVSERDYTVTVQLRDGTPYVIPTRFIADGSPRVLTAAASSTGAAVTVPPKVPAASPTAPRASPLAAAAAADPVLPLGRRVVIFNGFPGNELHEGAQRKVRGLFESVGYVVDVRTATIDELQAAGFMDVMWIDTHGLYPKIKTTPAATPIVSYALLVQAPPPCSALPDAECARYRKLVTDGKAAYGEATWAVFPAFVRAHLSFKSERSMAVLDACESADDTETPTEMRRAFQAVGAGQVYGWVHEVYAGSGTEIMTRFFDALLGTNVYFKDTYPLRPYAVADVFAHLSKKDLMRDKFPGAPAVPAVPAMPGHPAQEAIAAKPPGIAIFSVSGLTPPTPKASGLVLRPSIRDFTIREDATMSRIRIYGFFGDAGGTITVSGQQLLNVTWGPWQIEADLPNAGAGIAGPIVATSGNLASTPVPITLWTGTAEQLVRSSSVFGAPGFELTASCVATFRQSLIESRVNLESDPELGSFGAVDLQPIPNGDLNRCNWSVSGEGKQGDRTTLAGPAANAVTTQRAPTYTNLRVQVAPVTHQVFTFFGVEAPLHYKTYDKDGKLVLEGDFNIGADPAVFARATVRSPTWRFDNTYSGAIGSDPRDTGSFTMHLVPKDVPTVDTPR